MYYVVNTVVELIFCSVYFVFGRMIWGRDFGTAKSQVKKWKLFLLGAVSYIFGFAVIVLLLWAGSVAFNEYHHRD